MSEIVQAPGRTWLRTCLFLMLAPTGCAETERTGVDEEASVAFMSGPDASPDASRLVETAGDRGRSDAMSSDRATARDSGPPLDIAVALPDGWVQTPSRCGVRFWGAPDMLEIAEQGIDSCVFHFRTAHCEFSGGSGAFSDPLTQDEGELDFEASMERIDGREGKLVQYRLQEGGTQPYAAAILVPLPSPAGWELAANLHATCSSIAAREEALLSIRTATIRPAADADAKLDAGVADASSSVTTGLIPIIVGGYGSVSVYAGEVFTLVMQFIGDTGAVEPQISSPIVRFVGIDATPSSLQTAGGTVRLFRFEARAVGAAEIAFPGTASGDVGMSMQRVATVQVYRP